MKPTIGRIVHVLWPVMLHANSPVTDQTFAAIVRQIDLDGSLDLWVFGIPVGFSAANVTEGNKRGEWHWPPRDEPQEVSTEMGGAS